MLIFKKFFQNIDLSGWDATDQKVWLALVRVSLLLLVGALFIFCIHQDWLYWCSPFALDKIGQFGDFVGGVIGTLVTLASVYFLIKTLNEQKSVNESVVKTNESTIKSNETLEKSNKKNQEQVELQLFDNKFNIIYNTYLNTVATYSHTSLGGTAQRFEGKNALDVIVKGLWNSRISSYQQYRDAVAFSLSKFE